MDVLNIGLNPQAVVGAFFDPPPWNRSEFQPGTRNIMSVARYHPIPEVSQMMLERLSTLTFVDFLALLQVPYVFMGMIEDEFFHCRTLRDLYDAIRLGRHNTQPRYPEALAVARLAFETNATAAFALIEHNAQTTPMWVE